MSPAVRWAHYYVPAKTHPTNPGFSKMPLCRWGDFGAFADTEGPGQWHPTMTERVVRTGDEVAPCYRCLDALTHLDEIKTLKTLEEMD